MNKIECPKDLNQFLLGEPYFKNVWQESECEVRKFYGDCYHCFATAIAKRDKDIIGECNSVENKGEWIAQDIHNCCTEFKCSECGYVHNFMHLYGKPTADYSYCPNCGARMKGSAI